MNHSLKWAVFGISSLLAFSCSHTSKITELKDLPALSGAASGVAIPVTLGTDHPIVATDGCTMFFWQVHSVKTFEVKVQPGSNVIFAEFPPGLYGLQKVYCSQKTWSLAFERLPQFQVYEGKISVIGTYNFFVSEELNFSFKSGQRDENRRDILALLGRLSPENQSRVVSGYEGKPINSVLLDPAGRPGKWELTDDAGEKVKHDDRSWPNFKSCFEGEWDVNRLWMGVLTLDVTTEGSNVTETKIEDSWNTYTDHFVDCVKSKLADFHPTLKKKLHYKIYL